MKNIVVLISGRGSNMEAIVRACAAEAWPARVAAVISNRAGAAGLDFAAAHGIATAVVEHTAFASREAFDAALAEAVGAFSPDVVALAGFMRILSPEFVQRFEGRLLNIHPSLLPAYKGLDTHARVLAARESHHGASVHYVTAELDGGPVLMRGRLRVRSNDTVESISARVHALEHIIYPHVCSLIATGYIQWRNGTVFMNGNLLVDGNVLLQAFVGENHASA